MIEIKITDTVSDTLDSRYIYVDSFFMLNDNYDKLENGDCYQRYDDNYIDTRSTFESIIELGNYIMII